MIKRADRSRPFMFVFLSMLQHSCVIQNPTTLRHRLEPKMRDPRYPRIAVVGCAEWYALVRDALGSSALIVPSADTALAQRAGCDIAIVDFDSPAGLAPVVRGSTGLIVAGGPACRSAFAELFEDMRLLHLVGKNGGAERRELAATVEGLVGGDTFGLHRHLSAEERQSFTLSRSSQKRETLDGIMRFAAAANAPSRVAGLLWVAAEELLTNALYNAPVDAHGHRPLAHRPRSEEVALADHEAVVVDVAFDGRQLAVAVTDPFGSAEPEHLVGNLGRCFRRGDDQVADKPGGAGLGLFRLFESVGQLIFNIAPGQKTEAIGIIDTKQPMRALSTSSKSFHVFRAGGSEGKAP
jgi:hypothetical protein